MLDFEARRKEINFGEILGILKRRKRLAIIAFLVVFGFMTFSSLRKRYVPLYRSHVDLVVKQEPTSLPFASPYFEEFRFTTNRILGSSIARVLSLTFAEKLVSELNMVHTISDLSSGLTVDVESGEVTDGHSARTLEIALVDEKGTFQVSDKISGELIGTGLLGRPFNGDSYFFSLDSPSFRPGDRFTLHLYPPRLMAGALKNSISVEVLTPKGIGDEAIPEGSVPGVGSRAVGPKVTVEDKTYPAITLDILRVSLYWGNPEEVTRVLTALGELLIEEDKRDKALQFTQSGQFIGEQLEIYSQQLAALEDSIRVFKEAEKLTDLSAKAMALAREVSDLEAREIQLKYTREQVNRLKSLESEYDGAQMTLVLTLIDDPVLKDLHSQEVSLKTELASLRQEYSVNHPKIISMQARIDEIRDHIINEIDKNLSVLDAEDASLKSQIRSTQARLEEFPEKELKLLQLEREKRTAEELYLYFSRNREEARIQESGVVSDLEILDYPVKPLAPANPKRTKREVLFGLLLGIVAGIGVAFLREILDTSVKSEEDVRTKTGLPVFAVIPYVRDNHQSLVSLAKNNGLEHRGQPGDNGDGDGDESAMIANFTEKAPEYESLRTLAVNLRHADPDKTYKTILITSPGPAEGKSLLTVNLGFILALGGSNVLLVDTDHRKPTLHLDDYLKVNGKPGLFDLLLKKVPGSKARHRTKIEGLDVITAGDIPPNPTVVLESSNFEDSLSRLLPRYDYILIDSPPALMFADAAVMASRLDGTLIVSRFGRTPAKALLKTKETLERVGADIIGVVLNGVTGMRSGSYYYPGYGYYNRYYNKYYRHKDQTTEGDTG
jgi:tyrosine-protein kinase Etk/Wzc